MWNVKAVFERMQITHESVGVTEITLICTLSVSTARAKDIMF